MELGALFKARSMTKRTEKMKHVTKRNRITAIEIVEV